MRHIIEHLPLGPSEGSAIAGLEDRRTELAQRAEALRAKMVLRPEVSQFGPLQRELAQFLGSLGSVDRALALCKAVEVYSQHLTHFALEKASIFST